LYLTRYGGSVNTKSNAAGGEGLQDGGAVSLFAITGITGNVGGEVARNLLAAKQPVRAVVRDLGKGAAWAERGCDVARADIGDASALAAAFQGVEGVFVLVPPNFDPTPGFPEAQAIADSLFSALEHARPGRVVYLSTIGAQATQPNLLTQHAIIERVLGESPIPISFLRPGWFIENSSWDLAPAREQGVIPSFLQPLDKPVPMAATADIGRVAAELLRMSPGIEITVGPLSTTAVRIAVVNTARACSGLTMRPT
jgi:uncharacterized protein YbjT (DUF2867 family)